MLHNLTWPSLSAENPFAASCLFGLYLTLHLSSLHRIYGVWLGSVWPQLFSLSRWSPTSGTNAPECRLFILQTDPLPNNDLDQKVQLANKDARCCWRSITGLLVKRMQTTHRWSHVKFQNAGLVKINPEKCFSKSLLCWKSPFWIKNGWLSGSCRSPEKILRGVWWWRHMAYTSVFMLLHWTNVDTMQERQSVCIALPWILPLCFVS